MDVVTTFNERLGENIRLLRKRAKLTQLQVAVRMNYTPQHINKLERGHACPPLATLLRMAQILKCDMRELLEGLEEYV